MRQRMLLVMFLCLLSAQGFAFERKARLQFQPDTPVQLTSEVSLNLTQSLPGLSLSTKGTQVITSLLTIESQDSGLPVTRPPFDGTFVLKSLKISLRANDEEIAFDSEKKDSSLYLSQVSKIIDRPIVLHFGDKFEIKGGEDSLKLIAKQLPVFEEVNPEALLTDLLFLAFSLSGEELKEGMAVSRPSPLKSIPSLPKEVRYEITSIDDYNIHAKISGEIEKNSFPLMAKVKANGKDEAEVMVTLMGSLEGKGKWNRDNALISEVEASYHYHAHFSLGEWEWMMHVELKAHHLARLKN